MIEEFKVRLRLKAWAAVASPEGYEVTPRLPLSIQISFFGRQICMTGPVETLIFPPVEHSVMIDYPEIALFLRQEDSESFARVMLDGPLATTQSVVLR